ncbi:hypothetical protein D047_4122B, partial [Vibrio parahaemolyticus VPTS-2010_2]
IKSHHYR